MWYMRTRKNTVGVRIKRLREDLDVLQKDLAAKIGIGNSHLSQIERGEKRPTSETLASIAKALDTTTDYLLLLTDEVERLQALQAADAEAGTRRNRLEYARDHAIGILDADHTTANNYLRRLLRVWCNHR